MNLLEIIMLIIGILVILLSCVVVANPERKRIASITDSEIKDMLHDKIDNLKEQQSEILSSVSDEITSRTEDYLSKLSNEKIMAVTEYSDQILEKINRNHEEVVFLYNMLNTKEKELKEMLRKINSSQQQLKEIISKSPDENEPAKETLAAGQPANPAQNLKLKTPPVKPASETETQPVSINTAEIIKLYKQGDSVLNIAKQLGIGQGEVKLVIDLFTDR